MKNYIIAENQKTSWSILLSNKSSDSEKYAAEELQKYLKEISGAEFEITHDDKRVNNSIIVGYCSSIEGINYAELGDEGYIIQTHDNNIIITGGKKRGTLYGIYSFLEDYLGCRWFTPEVSKIPKKNKIES